MAQRCPRSWWGGTSLSTNFLDLMFSAPSERFSAPTRRYPRTVIPSGVKKGRRLPEEVGPKTLSRPRAVKTDRKFCLFHFPGSLKSIFGSKKNHRLTKSIPSFPFFHLRSLRPTILMSCLFSGSKQSQERYSFINYKLITLAFASYFPHKTNVLVFFHCFLKTHLK